MAKSTQESLLKRAEQMFLKGAYQDALTTYALALKEDPQSQEARVGVYLSDLASENDQEAQALYDYYQIIKHDRNNAADIIDEIISSIDEAKTKIGSITQELIDQLDEHHEDDAITYAEFKEAVHNRGDFKRTLEDVMFSAKVVISERDEFIDFIQTLRDEGYKQEAIEYLESTLSMFENDPELLRLYGTLIGEEET